MFHHFNTSAKLGCTVPFPLIHAGCTIQL